MYYTTGLHKVLKLDTQVDTEQSEILCIQANHERELFFILTTRSIHIWYPRPLAEIVCHRRSKQSIERIGFNKAAVWRTDSSVIAVATDQDQLLFFQLRRRNSSPSAKSFLLSGSSNGDAIYHIKLDSKNVKKMLNGEPPPDGGKQNHIPALSLYSFGKLDLSSVGIACLMSAEEELIVGSRDGEMYGVHWDGNVDQKFPWSLSNEVQQRSDFLVDLKFSSVLSGFAFVFRSGRVGFMPSQIDHEKLESVSSSSSNEGRIVCDTNIRYLSEINNAVCTEINHRHRLIAFGLKNSKIIVCNIDDSNLSLKINQTLELNSSKFPCDISKLGKVQCLRYSPDNYAIAASWENGELVVWSVFGSLLFCSKQWQVDPNVNIPMQKPIRISTMAWGREGFSLWLCSANDDNQDDQVSIAGSSIILNGTSSLEQDEPKVNGLDHCRKVKEDILVLPLARCNLSSNPHSTCSSDSLVLMAEERIYVGLSVPQGDKFDHWIVIDLLQAYLNAQHPLKYSSVDRECKNLAIAGNRGMALFSLETNTWKCFVKKSHENSFSVCGDLIWWQNFLIFSCFNYNSESFEIRAYPTKENLDNNLATIQTISMEIIKMSIFENRLLVLFSDGTLGMFMLNLRRRPSFRNKSRSTRSNSVTVSSNRNFINQPQQHQSEEQHLKRPDLISSWSHPLKSQQFSPGKEMILQISPIENLIISNLQANPYCISSIALTRLHFKNSRHDDSILLNSCGRLFLLERQEPPDLSSTSSLTAPQELRDSSLDSSNMSTQNELKMSSPNNLTNSIHLASASMKSVVHEPSALSNVTFKAVSVIATNVEQYWISPEISSASEMSYFKRSLWLYCGGDSVSDKRLQVWLPLLNDKNDPPNDLYVPDRIMLPIKCDIYPLAIRSSSPSLAAFKSTAEVSNCPDDAIVLGAESEVLFRDCKMFTEFPYMTVKRQCRIYLHRILRELLLSQHLGYYAKKIAESCQSLTYFAHCFELLLHEVLEEEATSPVPLPDPMLPQVVKFIRQFPVYLETVVYCARKSELTMWSHLFDEQAVGNPKRLFQECLDRNKLDTAASCLIILQTLDRNIVTSRMVKELIRAAQSEQKFHHLIEDLESFLARAELDCKSLSTSPESLRN